MLLNITNVSTFSKCELLQAIPFRGQDNSIPQNSTYEIRMQEPISLASKPRLTRSLALVYKIVPPFNTSMIVKTCIKVKASFRFKKLELQLKVQSIKSDFSFNKAIKRVAILKNIFTNL